MSNDLSYTMSVGRDYRTASKYEFVIYKGEEIVAREGYFNSAATARRHGLKAAEKLQSEEPQGELF